MTVYYRKNTSTLCNMFFSPHKDVFLPTSLKSVYNFKKRKLGNGFRVQLSFLSFPFFFFLLLEGKTVRYLEFHKSLTSGGRRKSEGVVRIT